MRQVTPWSFTDTIPNPVAEKVLAFKVCSRSLDGYSAELGSIIASCPIPNETSAIVIHNCHGIAIQPNQDASFANRRNHLVMGVSGNGPPADMESKPEVRDWSASIGEGIDKAGLNGGWAYVNFSPPQNGDGKLFYGVDGVKRLRKLKEKLDPEWFFSRGVPDMEVR